MTRWNWMLVALAVAAAPADVDAQGTIRGVVRSGDSGVGLGNARVEIPALGLISHTLGNGNFTITGVAAGTDWGTATWVRKRVDGEWMIIHGHGVHYPGDLP